VQHTYKTDVPNKVHQLNLSISQNYYLINNGEIQFQQKKIDINWKNYNKSSKRHLVNFLIRDQYSSCFYAETHPIGKIEPNLKKWAENIPQLKLTGDREEFNKLFN
jgi:hypothetical protein